MGNIGFRAATSPTVRKHPADDFMEEARDG